MKIPIRHIRDVAVILDADLAAIYGVQTKRLNEQVKKNRGQNIKYLPYAFTEHGALMAANVLRSEGTKSRSGVSPLNPRQAARRRFYFAKRELGFHVRERTATYRVKRRRP